MLHVDKHVPAPTARNKQAFPFPRMEIGDSFVAPAKRKNSAYGRANQFKRTHPGWNYRSESQPDGTCRFWRIA